MKRILISCLAMTVILFLWSGLGQLFPWGVPSAQNVSAAKTSSSYEGSIANQVQVPSASLTTDDFDTRFMGHISTYTTDNSFSWIVTQPVPESYGGYFGREVLNQFLVALILSLLLYLSRSLPFKERMLLVLLAALAACTATYGQFLNWWQMPLAYGLGASLNLIFGWILVAFISARFILPSKPIETRTHL